MAAFSWKSVIPLSTGDRLAVVAASVELLIIPAFELFAIMPSIFGYFTASYWAHFLIGFFLWFNATGNMLMCMGVEISSGANILPSVLRPGWKYCPACMLNAPPRAHHCGDCKKCVLVRDHHCIFTGRCIGHNNIRYYLTMLFYLLLSATYCNYLNIDYAWELIETLSWRGVIAMFIPVIGWLFGFHSTMSFFSTVQCGICLFTSVQFFFLLFFHLRLLSKGQTTYEWRHSNPKKYNKGWRENFKNAFGLRWYLVWVAPFVPSPLPHDGIHFPESNGSTVKDM